ncbi:MAG TPA: ATP-binding protein [Nitrospiraceae bacterium]|nr:ATP-binding protein [Nitrospiraceae bacterium]
MPHKKLYRGSTALTLDEMVSFESALHHPQYSPASRTATQLLARAGVVMWQADIERRAFTYIGPLAESLFGFPLSRWSERGFWERRLHSEDRSRVLGQTENKSNGKLGYEMEYRLVAANGQPVWLHDTVLIARKGSGAHVLNGIMLDLTGQKEIERQLRELSGRLISTQEAERRRIARELHDDTSQRLALMAVRLDFLQQVAPASSERWLTKVTEISDEVKGISSEIHALCDRLHPTKLEQLGLVTCMKQLCRELNEQKRCQLTVALCNAPSGLSQDISLCLYRVAQEALANALKHSGASKIHVEMTRGEDMIRLSICDNGHGFAPTSQAGYHGLGLVSMRERLRLVHGNLSLHSSSCGVRIEVTVPIS